MYKYLIHLLYTKYITVEEKLKLIELLCHSTSQTHVIDLKYLRMVNDKIRVDTRIVISIIYDRNLS